MNLDLVLLHVSKRLCICGWEYAQVRALSGARAHMCVHVVICVCVWGGGCVTVCAILGEPVLTCVHPWRCSFACQSIHNIRVIRRSWAHARESCA